MKCPNCNSNNTRLSWLRDLTVVYWCQSCHNGFEVGRHRSRAIPVQHPSRVPSEDGATSEALAS